MLGIGLCLRRSFNRLSGWKPTSLSNLQMWLDANDSGTIIESSNIVSQWLDKSGKSNHVSQNTETNKPTLTTNKISFDDDSGAGNANPDYLEINPLPAAIAASNINVFYVKASTDLQAIDFTDDNVKYGATYESGGTAGIFTNMGTPTVYKDGNAASYANRGDIYTAIHDGNSHIVELVGVDWSTWSTLKLFAPLFQFSQTGDLYELIIVSGSISQGDRELIEGYLAHKWALTANLPVGHPYKSVAP